MFSICRRSLHRSLQWWLVVQGHRAEGVPGAAPGGPQSRHRQVPSRVRRLRARLRVLGQEHEGAVQLWRGALPLLPIRPRQSDPKVRLKTASKASFRAHLLGFLFWVQTPDSNSFPREFMEKHKHSLSVRCTQNFAIPKIASCKVFLC